MPPIPSARIMMQVKKNQQTLSIDSKEKDIKPVTPTIQATKIPANVKVKMPQNVQFFHQGQIKGKH